MIAIASAKINAVIIASKIRGEAEGLRPTALTAAKPTTPITAAGPKVAKNMIKIKIKLLIAIIPWEATPF